APRRPSRTRSVELSAQRGRFVSPVRRSDRSVRRITSRASPQTRKLRTTSAPFEHCIYSSTRGDWRVRNSRGRKLLREVRRQFFRSRRIGPDRTDARSERTDPSAIRIIRTRRPLLVADHARLVSDIARSSWRLVRFEKKVGIRIQESGVSAYLNPDS